MKSAKFMRSCLLIVDCFQFSKLVTLSGLHESSGGFPTRLTPDRIKCLPFPAIGLKTFTSYLTGISQQVLREQKKKKLTHYSGKESKKWLAGLDMAQRRKFVVWCAPTVCGISRKIVDKHQSTMSLPLNMQDF